MHSMTLKAGDTVVLPDMISYCNLPRCINPSEVEVASATKQWLLNGGYMAGRALDQFSTNRFPVFASLVFPKASPSHIRVCSDFLSWVYYVDDPGEAMKPEEVKVVADMIFDSFRNPDAVHSGDNVCRMTRE
jgi:hypothetical protein